MNTETLRPDLTVDDVAAEMACSRVHVYRIIKDGLLGAYKIGKSTRIKRESLDAFKAGNPWTSGTRYATPNPKAKP